jgi:hypothetical protein
LAAARYLEERDDPTIEEAAMAASCLAALDGDRHEEAAREVDAPPPRGRDGLLSLEGEVDIGPLTCLLERSSVARSTDCGWG